MRSILACVSHTNAPFFCVGLFTYFLNYQQKYVACVASLFRVCWLCLQLRTRKKVTEDVELVDMHKPGLGIVEVESAVEDAREVVLDQPSKVTIPISLPPTAPSLCGAHFLTSFSQSFFPSRPGSPPPSSLPPLAIIYLWRDGTICEVYGVY